MNEEFLFFLTKRKGKINPLIYIFHAKEKRCEYHTHLKLHLLYKLTLFLSLMLRNGHMEKETNAQSHLQVARAIPWGGI